MLEHQHARAENCANPLRLAHKERLPFGAVLDQLDRRVVHSDTADVRGLHLCFAGHLVRD